MPSGKSQLFLQSSFGTTCVPSSEEILQLRVEMTLHGGTIFIELADLLASRPQPPRNSSTYSPSTRSAWEQRVSGKQTVSLVRFWMIPGSLPCEVAEKPALLKFYWARSPRGEAWEQVICVLREDSRTLYNPELVFSPDPEQGTPAAAAASSRTVSGSHPSSVTPLTHLVPRVWWLLPIKSSHC